MQREPRRLVHNRPAPSAMAPGIRRGRRPARPPEPIALNSLLPQQIAPVDEPQAALTARLLAPRRDEIEAYFLALRAEVDADLSLQRP